jgi:hypothetical protein
MTLDVSPPPFVLFTPVVFFVFNRPELTRRVFAAIRAAQPRRLLVIADGPRAGHRSDVELCQQVRASILGSVDWPCIVETEFAEQNIGCGPRIFSGLQWAFSHVEEAIVLEDDCLPEPTFFRFCEEMLARYRNDAEVLMVAGTNFHGADPTKADRYLFTRHCSVWGWATWRRALAGYSLDLSWWRTRVQPRDLRPECNDWSEYRLICELLDAQKFGTVNTWDVQWFAHVFRQRGLSIVPGTNLVSNLGSIGTHIAAEPNSRQNLSRSAAQFPLCLPAAKERNRDYERFLVDQHRPWGGWMVGLLAARALRSPGGPLLRRCWHWFKRNCLSSKCVQPTTS